MTPGSDSESVLRRDLEKARQQYDRALAYRRMAEEHLLDLGGEHPDGAQSLHNANRVVAHAAEEFQRALKAFADEVLRHTRK